ncbi:MAG: hypothetical protein V7638_3409 [Acidobacteriota bacterium]|jgi:hypothetical protein
MNAIVQLLLIVVLFSQGLNMKQEQKVKTIEGADLQRKWNAALKDAQSNYPQSPIWVGYSFKVRHGVGVEIVLEPGHENQNLGLFFLYNPKTDSIRKFDILNMDREQDFQDPAYWLGHAETNENLNFLRLLIVAKNGDPMTPHLIEAIAMQDDPQADVTLKTLERDFRGKVEGTMSTYWLRERLTARQPVRGLADNVAGLTETLRNDQASLVVRGKAAHALGVCADPAGLKALAAFYPEAPNRTVKKVILDGAANKVNQTSVPLYLDVAAADRDPYLRQVAFQWLAEKAAKRIAWDLNPVMKLFSKAKISEEENAYLRKISRGGDASEMLIKVAETHPNIAVRKAAVARLGKLQGAKALEFFRKVLSHDAKAIPASAAVIRF